MCKICNVEYVKLNTWDKVGKEFFLREQKYAARAKERADAVWKEVEESCKPPAEKVTNLRRQDKTTYQIYLLVVSDRDDATLQLHLYFVSHHMTSHHMTTTYSCSLTNPSQSIITTYPYLSVT